MIALRVVNLLIEKSYKISFAESCTGGLLASSLIEVPNASRVLDEAYVTYAIASKEKILNIAHEVFIKHNVVSEEVAYHMALNVAKIANSEVGVGITGVAGPTGGTKEIPVGTVCFGYYILGKVFTEKMVFENKTRNEVRLEATIHAFQKLEELLSQK